MARYRESVCRLCRREGTKLFLKGDRCYSDKCAVERRPYPPGMHGTRRMKQSDYGIQLREKQKARRIYGVMESQFRNYFKTADGQKGVTGQNLLVLLERRLDTAVYRLGFATSRADARQLVKHGHIMVNGRKVDIPSYLLKIGDEIQIREKSRESVRVKEAMISAERKSVPAWLDLEVKAFKGVYRNYPTREDVALPVQEQLIVELYSK
ncbi:MAG TPA: 30S ribosomal protein S4 [Proteobacteria bacterium]|nr:30S ribosomal protein S4 [bacterium BMS3Abin14]HDL53044.1 30S ribosomal protein S4 [Pseudomonadota bacterium]